MEQLEEIQGSTIDEQNNLRPFSISIDPGALHLSDSNMDFNMAIRRVDHGSLVPDVSLTLCICSISDPVPQASTRRQVAQSVRDAEPREHPKSSSVTLHDRSIKPSLSS